MMAKWKGSAKFTRQEMDAEINGLARQTIAVMTQEARQTVVDGHPNVEVEHVVDQAWRHCLSKPVVEELMSRALIAEIKKLLDRDHLQ